MYISVCVCVCVCVCACLSVCVCVCVRVFSSICACLSVSVCGAMCVCVFFFKCERKWERYGGRDVWNKPHILTVGKIQAYNTNATQQRSGGSQYQPMPNVIASGHLLYTHTVKYVSKIFCIFVLHNCACVYRIYKTFENADYSSSLRHSRKESDKV